MGSANYDYRCKLVRWIDGDSCVLDIDLGFGLTKRETVRLAGSDAPEMHGQDKLAGEAALAFVISLVPVGELVTARTYKPSRSEDRYGRWLADVFLDLLTTVSSRMIEAGHAVPYFGGRR